MDIAKSPRHDDEPKSVASLFRAGGKIFSTNAQFLQETVFS